MFGYRYHLAGLRGWPVELGEISQLTAGGAMGLTWNLIPVDTSGLGFDFSDKDYVIVIVIALHQSV
jgi:hypothetical protein